MNRLSLLLSAIALALLAAAGLAQQRGARGQAPQTARTEAAIDLTGYWVPYITEDWKFRMLTPRKGDYDLVPLTPAGRALADQWDPVKDEAEGAQCRGYGAAAIMRAPGRIRVSWENDNVLRIDTEAGTQTRLFRFGESQPPGTEPTWQGHSVATWQYARTARGQPRTGSLKVVTTKLRPGYLRKNGVPYSGNAVVTEYFRRLTTPNGEQWLLVITEVDDPANLTTRFVTSTQFKKLPDRSDWKPEPCSAK
jgi:hypothetical protein